METSRSGPSRRAEFAAAARDAGVERIVYLGGLGEGTSIHLRSRQETAEGLGSTGIPLTYFRAAIVIGSGSESLRTIAYLVRRLPAMVTPSWTSTRTQPVGGERRRRLLELPGSAAASTVARSRSAVARSRPTGPARRLRRRPRAYAPGSGSAFPSFRPP